MKSSKNRRQQYGNSERKGGGSKREKGSKLDRKSSRGMIYENEELRLRTININAEVERGQSDIKRLRRENEQLRREIWTLRDECDRLNKRFKAKLLEHDHGGCNARHSGCSGGGRGSGHVCDSNCNSDDSDSCDTCKGNDDQCSDECCTGGSCPQLATKQPIIEFAPATPSTPTSRTDMPNLAVNCVGPASESTPNLHQAFDHLSVVSEETMSNAELHTQVPHNEMLHICMPESSGSQMTLPSLVGPLTPLTPIEQVANQLNDLQAVVPPLSYFENVLQDHMGSNIGNVANASSPTSRLMRHTNGWDYKLQSPFAHRKISGDNSQPALQIASLSPNTGQQQRQAPSQLLTTFVPTMVASTSSNGGLANATGLTVTAPSLMSQANNPAIETVAITTTPVSAPPTLNSPKHFFAPLKPRLKINTALANKSLNATNSSGVPVINTVATTPAADPEISGCQNCEPPDLYVHNALAAPYQRQALIATSAANAVPPPVPQRGSSSQVSPQLRACAHYQHQHMQERQQQEQHIHQHLHPHQYSHQHQQQHQRPLQQPHTQLQSSPVLQQSIVTITVTVDDADEVAAGADAIAACSDGAAVAANAGSNASTTALINSPYSLKASLHGAATLQALLSPAAMPAVFVAQPNTVITKLSEPIYATAQKRCKSLITAPALTKPLMAVTINPTQRLTPTPTTSNKSSAVATPMHSPLPAPTPTGALKAKLVDSQSQTESVNLETILNDIQSISEDILAIQLDKRKGNENDISKPLEQGDKNKKPYRSEMNLTLQYDGTKQAATTSNTNKTAAATQTLLSSSGGNNGRCTRSLEREHTDSPSPHIPDAMVPFPDKRTYIGFDQINNDARIALPPTSVANMPRPPLPPMPGAANKAQPSTPPARVFPAALNIRSVGMARATPVSIPQLPTEELAAAAGLQTATPVGAGLTPNKSQLYTVIASAAAKRAQYRNAMAHSLDVDLDAATAATGNDANTADVASEALSSEAARRKARRVSIACGDSSTPESPDPVTNPHLVRSQAQINLSDVQEGVATNATTTNSNTTTTTTTNTKHSSIGSCTDLPSALANPALRNLKQTSHSTPNSPHSARRRSNSNTMSPNNGVADGAYPPQSLSANTSPRHTANVHHHHTNSSCSNIVVAHQRKSSQDSTRGNPAEVSAVEAITGRSRCSRRHSDGTVASNAQRVSGTSGHHHHHHHHHHQHSASVLSNNLHHSHHSHQDSTSYSEHGSNSSASSRESSTSFSVRSNRRKISISSHTGGKIPWCGCWGNGCL
ncbi:mucin-2 isoform X2 [Anastrepha obliqua]|uniref:mucin-2 isoform X2 n=1 Tax=Anastrepha obliqua TaxID=95512 RepID=UPI002409C0A6|nr:mucin-2 isoform X2 [Anastrepha obliqua]